MKSPFPYILAGGLFVLIIGAIAWITQWMPNWRGPDVAPAPPGKESPVAISFSWKKAVWDEEDKDYALEIEKDKDGHFDFPFENLLNEPVKIGLESTSCDCTHVMACILPETEWNSYSEQIKKNPLTAKGDDWPWVSLANKYGPRDENKEFAVVPAKGKGLIRVGWHGRNRPAGYFLQLGVKIWHQPERIEGARFVETLNVATRISAPIRFHPLRGNVGDLAARTSGTTEFTLWTSTRETLDLKWEDAGPFYTYDAQPFSAEERRELEKKLRADKENTRVLQAFHFKVTVREQSAGKQMDQGPFMHKVSFLLDGDNKVVGPQINGTVQGDIVVGAGKTSSKIDLETFRAAEGASRTVSLWTEDEKVALEVEGRTPRTLEAKISKGEKVGSRMKWQLEVTVPPGTQYGALPEDSVIILRTVTDPPRFIRIPVAGNGQS
jgi:hypothetical protein